MQLKNKNVLVTGADGFIGSHLVESLLAAGANVRALSLYNSSNNWGWLEVIPELSRVEVITGDIRDITTCRKITKGIDTVFHLAALISIPYSYLAPEAYVETNIRGTANLCQAALDNGCSRFVHTSTSEVYGSAQYIPIDEKHPLQPQSPYSASKIGADSMALSYHNAFELPLTVVRPFNTYGPRQSARAIIPTIITQIASGKQEIALGDVRPTRDFTFVKDTCAGFIAIATAPNTIGEIVNVGTNNEVSMLDLFEKITALMNSSAKRLDDSARKRPVKSEVLQLCCNNEKLFRLTGFKPQTSLEEGLKTTIEWFGHSHNLKNYKAEIYNV